MPSFLPFLYDAENREISDDLARRHFTVKWVVHRYETLPAEVENSAMQDLDKLVESCQGRFPEMRGKHPHTPPDGFIVLDGTGHEVRRWFESARPKTLDINPRSTDDTWDELMIAEQ